MKLFCNSFKTHEKMGHPSTYLVANPLSGIGKKPEGIKKVINHERKKTLTTKQHPKGFFKNAFNMISHVESSILIL